MLRDASNHAALGSSQGVDEWVNLTPREMIDCYYQICTKYRGQLLERPDLPDLEHRVKIMYDSLIENNIVLFYFVQRYPRMFHNLTTRTIPKWFWRDFLFHFLQTQVFVETGVMTIEQRLDSIDEMFQQLNPGGEEWKKDDDYKTYLLVPSKVNLTPELRQAVQAIRELRQRQ